MNDQAISILRMSIDTIIRDEAYDGGLGALSEDQFNAMAARIADLVVTEVMDSL